MSEATARRSTFGPTTVEILFSWFLRIVAVYCLLFGALYWVRLIGVYPGALWRFDLMPVHWQVVAVMLAVLFPFAAAGLWMLASWGPVIWFICAATEFIMYAIFPERFGRHLAFVAVHILIATGYFAFRLVIYVQALKAAREG